MGWFSRSEPRAAPEALTDAEAQLIGSAYGQQLALAGAYRMARTGTLEACARLVGAAFAAAQPAADLAYDPWPSAKRSQAGRALIRSGEWLARIEVAGGRLRLVPFTSCAVTEGGPDPETWMLLGTLAAPGSMPSPAVYMWQEVVALHWATEPAAPWLGVAPLDASPLTKHLHAQVEAASIGETSLAQGQYFISGTDDASVAKQLASGLRARAQRGSSSPFFVTGVDSLAGGSAGAAYGAFGTRFESALVELRNAVAETVAEACGISPAMWGSQTGQASREASRLFVETTAKPLLQTVSDELSAKLDGDYRYELPESWHPDPTSTARALKQMVDAGVPLSDARIMLEV